MSSRIKKIFFSQFMFWIIAIAVGKYFLFKVDFDVLKNSNLPLTQRLLQSVSIPRMNLGIDLQGGAHLVVGVEIEKAIEKRLASEGKMIEQMLKREEGGALPEQKAVKNQALSLTFKDVKDASTSYQMIKAKRPYLKITRNDLVVEAVLPPEEAQRIRSQAVEQAVSILKRRLDTVGVQGLVVQQHGDRQIVVQLPGNVDVEEKKDLILKTAHLELKIVEKQATSEDELLDEYDGELPSDRMIVPGRDESSGKRMYYLVSAFADVTGERITFAKEDFDQYGRLVVVFNLDSVGTQEFADLTSNNVGKHIGIIIDGVMYSAPVVQEPITGGSARISGRYTSEEARALAIVLNSGSLSAPLKFEYETRVGASLGKDSIRKGLTSCLIGLLLLFFFALVYYKLAGLFAFFALLFNLFLVLFFLSWFKFALTLPGIAGLVLTIGMAIDASILIYERIREELAGGTTMRKAVQDGFKSATVVILDSNITTFLTGVVLFKFGGPAIQGFAVVLMAGIVATIFASIFFLKSLFLFMLDNTKLKRFGL